VYITIVRDTKGEKLSFDEALDRSSSMWKKSTDISRWEHEGSYVLVRRKSEILHVFVVIAGIICCVVAIRGKDPIRQYTLINRLENEKMSVRLEAARTLGEIGSFWAVGPLIDTLTDESSGVREAAAQTLGAIGDNRSVEPLIAVLEDKESNVRWTAAQALDALDWSADSKSEKALYLVAKQEWAECVKIGQTAVDPLMAVLSDENWSIRKTATQTLGAIGDIRAVEPLMAALKDENPDVREAVVNALGKIDDSRAIEPLTAALSDKDSNVRETVAQALDTLGWSANSENEKAMYLVAKREWDNSVKIGQPAVEPLIAILMDESSGVQIAAAQALGAIGDSQAVEPLIAGLTDESSSVQIAAAQALGAIRDNRAVEPLIAALADKSFDVREAATNALNEIGQPAVEPLITRLTDESSDVRKAAAHALDTLNWSANSENEKAMYFVAKQEWDGCVKIGKSAVEPLIAVLSDENWSIRKAAIQTLRTIGDSRAVEPLMAVFINKDEDLGVRGIALDALVT